MRNKLLEQVEQSSLREEQLAFEIGDTVDVHCRILEGNKERIQVFSGVVIARKGGGVSETFTVRRIVAGEGVERIFPVHSPKIAKLVVKRHGKVRRAKLYYLRERSGRSARIREKLGANTKGQRDTSVDIVAPVVEAPEAAGEEAAAEE